MDVEVRKILILIIILNSATFVQLLEHNIQKESLPSEGCDIILVSHPGIDKGIKIIYLRHFKNYLSPDLGRGAIKFQSFQNLLEVEDSKKFRSVTSRMSCLMTVAEMSNELEVSKMIEIIHELKIAQKYLIIFIDTLNTTVLHERTINFNVMINHGETGVLNVHVV